MNENLVRNEFDHRFYQPICRALGLLEIKKIEKEYTYHDPLIEAEVRETHVRGKALAERILLRQDFRRNEYAVIEKIVTGFQINLQYKTAEDVQNFVLEIAYHLEYLKAHNEQNIWEEPG